MSIVRRAMMAGATFAVAGAAGFVMQNGDAVAARFADQPVAPAETAVAQAPATETPIMDTASVVVSPSAMAGAMSAARDAAISTAQSLGQVLPEVPETAGVQVAALEEDQSTRSDAPVLAAAPALEVPASPVAPAQTPDCGVTMTSTPTGAGMVQLTLEAPCHASERVTIQHDALAFTEMTDAAGHLNVAVPAMSDTAVFFAFFIDQAGAMVETRVPEFSAFDRVAILFNPQDALHIHAREFGADYGDAGHVWADAPRNPMHGIKAEGGFLTRLGNANAFEPQIAEIYTFPTATTRDSGAVRLSVEAEITAQNCGRAVEALSLQTGADGKVGMVDLSLTMPDCDAVGDFLVLNSLLQDLKIAGN